MGESYYEVSKAVVLFKFVAVQSDGDMFDPSGEYKTMYDLGQDGWEVAGMIPQSSYAGFGHTLIMQKREHITEFFDKG